MQVKRTRPWLFCRAVLITTFARSRCRPRIRSPERCVIVSPARGPSLLNRDFVSISKRRIRVPRSGGLIHFVFFAQSAGDHLEPKTSIGLRKKLLRRRG